MTKVNDARLRGMLAHIGPPSSHLAVSYQTDELHSILSELLELRAAAKVRAIREGDGEWVSRLERYEQFTDGWGDEVIGLKQHPKGDYVKFVDVVVALAASPIPTAGGEKE